MRSKSLLTTMATIILFSTSFSIFSGQSNSSSQSVESTKDESVISTSVVSRSSLAEDEDYTPSFEGWEDATEVDKSSISFTVTRSTTTSTSQSYTLSIASEITGYANASRDTVCYIALEEPTNLSGLDVQENEEDMPYYNGYAYSVSRARNGVCTIPAQLQWGEYAFISVTSISSELIEDSIASTVTEVNIPSTINGIADDAFSNLAGNEGLTFNIGMTEEEAQFDLDVFPEGSTINWLGNSDEDVSYRGTTSKAFSSGEQFIIGINAPDYGYVYKLSVQYDIVDDNGNYVETRYQELEVSASYLAYDAVGLGSTSLTKYIDIELGEGENVDDDSLYFYNFYYAKSNSGGNPSYVPALPSDSTEEVTYTMLYTKPSVTAPIEDDISNYISYEYSGLSSFSGYTTFSIDVTVSDFNIYEIYKSSSYNSNYNSINNGTYYLRYRFTSFNYASYRIVYENEEGENVSVTLAITTPVDYHQFSTSETSTVSFLIKNKDVASDFTTDSVRSIEVIGLRITIDIFNPSSNSIISKSAMETRFGYFEILPLSEESASYTSFNAVLIILAIVYAIVYWAITIAIYFYRKNKYKNDEFRRMNNKSFFKQAVTAFFCIGIVLYAFTFIYIRFWPMNNSVIVYNPTDVFVVLFAIAAIIAIGYYIRYFYLAYKAAKHRKEVKRLKLDQDVEDDGTK